jgi:hypothetical protein
VAVSSEVENSTVTAPPEDPERATVMSASPWFSLAW